MKILISGGAGFIGRHLCARLGQTHALWVLSRGEHAPAGTELLQANPAQEGDWQERAAGMDAIINLAGESIAGRWTASKKKRLLDSRVQVTRRLVRVAKRPGSRVKALLSASGAGYYGDGEQAVDEWAPPGQGFLAEMAQAWETEARRAENAGVRVCRLRLGVVLGADGGALPKMMRPFRMGLGGRLGSGQQWLSWIHIRDAVEAMIFLMDRQDLDGAFNLCAPEPVRNASFGASLARILGRRSWLPAPTVALKLALGEFADTLLEGQRVLPRRLQEAGFAFRYPVLDGALEHLFP